MEESIRFATKFLGDLLSFFGLNIDVKATYEDDVIELSVPSSHLNGFLIGQRGETLRALQSIVSSALRSGEFEYFRVNIDVADYKKHNNEKLAEMTAGWVKDVRQSKANKDLRPMNGAERRIVHKEIAELTDVETESIGEGRDRFIRIKYIDTDTNPEPIAKEE